MFHGKLAWQQHIQDHGVAGGRAALMATPFQPRYSDVSCAEPVIGPALTLYTRLGRQCTVIDPAARPRFDEILGVLMEIYGELGRGAHGGGESSDPEQPTASPSAFTTKDDDDSTLEAQGGDDSWWDRLISASDGHGEGQSLRWEAHEAND